MGPSKPNKRSREEIAEIDGELLSRANRLGRKYQPVEERREEEEQETKRTGDNRRSLTRK